MKLVAAALVAVAASWMLAGSAAGQAAEVRVVVNGVDVPLAAPAVVFNGQVMAPMSGLFEPMGAIAAYYETDRSIVVTNRVRTTVVLWLNETAALVNGQPQSLPVAPALLRSEVFVPVQATFALLGAWARFDETERAVFVNSQITGITPQVASGALQVSVDATGPVQVEPNVLSNPDRLVVDFINAQLRTQGRQYAVGDAGADRIWTAQCKREISVEGTSVVSIRAAQFTARPPVTRIVVTLKRKLNYVVNRSAGQLTIDLSTNMAARGHLVAIDPGHGGQDPGAIGPSGLREADVVLDIAMRVRDLLARDGIRVLLLRDSDATVDLEDRPRLAREGGATLYVSIHANASPRAAVNGTETFYLTPQSLVLAQMIQDELGVVLGIPSRGIKTANFVVLRDAEMPAVLVETAFISHADDELRLRDQAFRQHVAEAVHHGIARFLAIYPVPQQAP